MKQLSRKIKKLTRILKGYKRVLVAFSGGVDSTYLVVMAKKILGKENVRAVIAKSPTYPKRELQFAKKILKRYQIPYQVISSQEVTNQKFRANTYRRCFYCKNELLKKIFPVAQKNKMVVCFGTNFSDLKDFRPGNQAIKKWKAKMPLAEAKMTKKDIRKHSRILNLPTANKPAQACLASRVPFFQQITEKKLKRIEVAEDFLKKLGFGQLRVRDHNDIARIEIEPKEFPKIIKKNIRTKICQKLSRFWKHITFDLAGYQKGIFNPK